jgi:hypothetical protein
MDIRKIIRNVEILHLPLIWIFSAQVSWFLFFAFLKLSSSKEVELGVSFVATLLSIGIVFFITKVSEFSPRVKLVTIYHSFISVTLILRIVRQLNGHGRLPLWEEWIFLFVFLSALLALYRSPLSGNKRYEFYLSLLMIICLSTRMLMIAVDPWSSVLIEEVIFIVFFVAYSSLNIPKGSSEEIMIRYPLTISTLTGMSLGMFVFLGMKLSWLRFSGTPWGIHGAVFDTFIDALTLILPWLLYIEYNTDRGKIGAWN